MADSHKLDHESMSALLVKIIVTICTFLTSFQIRDGITQTVQVLAPDDAIKKLSFSWMIAAFFLFLTVVIAYGLQDYID